MCNIGKFKCEKCREHVYDEAPLFLFKGAWVCGDCVLFVLRHPNFLACVYLSDIIITVMPRATACQFGRMYFCIVSPQR